MSIFSSEGGCNDVLFIERVGGGGVGITLCLIYSEVFFGGGGLVFYCRCFVLVAAASVNFIRGEHSIGFTTKYIHVHVNT